MAKPSAFLRLFVAVHPPPEIVAALLAALDGLELPPHRVVPAPQVHLTLQFVGDTPARSVDDVAESVARATGGLEPFALTAHRLATFPPGRPARLVAAETDAPPTLLELQRRLAARLARAPRRRAGDRFRPHLTLCRFTAPATETVDAPIDVAPFDVARVVLVRSTLRPNGARHHEVASAPLGA